MAGTSASKLLKNLPRKRQQRIRKQAKQEIQVYKTLQELRKQLNITQTDLADQLGIKQANISKMEHRSDMLLSTLQDYVEVMGCELEIIVKTPDQSRIKIESLTNR